jgi:D-lactate dehydrogenase
MKKDLNKKGVKKIAFFELEGWEKDFFSKSLKDYELIFSEEELSEKNVNSVKDANLICIFIGSDITKKVLSKFENLKGIITRSTGFDHIDLKACKKNKITVSNTPYYGENTVAEHTFALILALSRKIVESVERTKKRDFSLEGLRGFDLKDKTIGVVGTGHIGSYVAKISKGFGMNVLAFNKQKNEKIAKKIGFKYAKNFEDLIKNSDIITFHVPLIKSTYHMLNKKNISKVKKGAYLVNTSRGEVVENGAIIEALNKGILKGAGLDVLEDENIIKEEKQLLTKKFSREEFFNVVENNVLLNYENVIITPHNAFNTQEALQRIMDTTLENIQGMIKNKPNNVVK